MTLFAVKVNVKGLDIKSRLAYYDVLIAHIPSTIVSFRMNIGFVIEHCIGTCAVDSVQ